VIDMKKGDRVIVSDFLGDMETIGVESVFVRMADDGRYICKSATCGRKSRETYWHYCELASKFDED